MSAGSSFNQHQCSLITDTQNTNPTLLSHIGIFRAAILFCCQFYVCSIGNACLGLMALLLQPVCHCVQIGFQTKVVSLCLSSDFFALYFTFTVRFTVWQ